MKYPFEKNANKIINRIIPITQYAIFINLFCKRERAIKIGKIGSTYRGSELKVPVNVGIKKARTENIK